MARQTKETEELKQGLLADVGKAQQRVAKTRGSLGIKGGGDATFAPQSVRIGKQKVGEVELKNLSRTLDRGVKDLVRITGLQGDVERSKFESKLRERANKIQMFLMREAGSRQVAEKLAQMDAKQKQSFLNALGEFGALAGSEFIGSFGPKKKYEGVGVTKDSIGGVDEITTGNLA